MHEQDALNLRVLRMLEGTLPVTVIASFKSVVVQRWSQSAYPSPHSINPL